MLPETKPVQPDSSRWSPLDPDNLQLRSWDSGTVVYNGLSGDTHLLSPLAGDILQQLKTSPATCEQLLGALPDHFREQKESDETLDIIEIILHDLQAIDLVICNGRH